jgi:hypothetical protein
MWIQYVQSDQIGRIFDLWATVFFGQFCEKVQKVSGTLLSLAKNVLGYSFGEFFPVTGRPDEFVKDSPKM